MGRDSRLALHRKTDPVILGAVTEFASPTPNGVSVNFEVVE